MKLYGGGEYPKGGRYGGANLLGGRKSCDTGTLAD